MGTGTAAEAAAAALRVARATGTGSGRTRKKRCYAGQSVAGVCVALRVFLLSPPDELMWSSASVVPQSTNPERFSGTGTCQCQMVRFPGFPVKNYCTCGGGYGRIDAEAMLCSGTRQHDIRETRRFFLSASACCTLTRLAYHTKRNNWSTVVG